MKLKDINRDHVAWVLALLLLGSETAFCENALGPHTRIVVRTIVRTIVKHDAPVVDPSKVIAPWKLVMYCKDKSMVVRLPDGNLATWTPADESITGAGHWDELDKGVAASAACAS